MSDIPDDWNAVEDSPTKAQWGLKDLLLLIAAAGFWLGFYRLVLQVDELERELVRARYFTTIVDVKDPEEYAFRHSSDWLGEDDFYVYLPPTGQYQVCFQLGDGPAESHRITPGQHHVRYIVQPIDVYEIPWNEWDIQIQIDGKGNSFARRWQGDWSFHRDIEHGINPLDPETRLRLLSAPDNKPTRDSTMGLWIERTAPQIPQP